MQLSRTMAIYFFLVEGSGGLAPPKPKKKHHLFALKIRLEAHILVLSATAVAAEVAAAAAAESSDEAAAAANLFA